MIRIFKVGIILFLVIGLPCVGLAQTKILSIKVKGNRRVETDAILNQVIAKPGRTFYSKQIRDSIQNIYDLGFF